MARERARSDIRRRIQEAVLFSTPLLATGLFTKYSYLHFGALEIATRALGLEEFDLLEYLAFYARDILESLLWLPLLLLILGIPLRTRARYLVFFFVVQLFVVVGMTGWATQVTIGRLPTYPLVSEFFFTLAQDPAAVDPRGVLPPRQWLKVIAALLLGFAPLIAVLTPALRRVVFGPLNTALSATVLALAVVVVTVQGSEASLYHGGQFQRIYSEFARDLGAELPEVVSNDPSAMKRMYTEFVFPKGLRETTPQNLSKRDATQRPNVLIIILETASQRDYRIGQSDSPMTRVNELVPNSLIARRHHTSYPYSVRANFTLLSGVYDLPFKKMMMDHLLTGSPRPMDALPRILSERGYHTRYFYGQRFSHANEVAMLGYLGVDELISQDDFPEPPDGLDDDGLERWRERELFHRVRDESIASAETGTPFFHVLASGIGHAPYPDLRPDSEKMGGAPESWQVLQGLLIEMMDELIGELIDDLRAAQILEQTIVVITGDHGVRSKADDPGLDLRFLNSESFHVPMLIYDPVSFPRTIEIDWMTSHVDVAPTILSLLGDNSRSYLHHGLLVTDPRIQDRITFLLGGHYFGSNGLHYRGRFLMRNDILQLTLANDAFQFAPANALQTNDTSESGEAARRMERYLRDFLNIQMTWAGFFRDAGADSGVPRS